MAKNKAKTVETDYPKPKKQGRKGKKKAKKAKKSKKG